MPRPTSSASRSAVTTFTQSDFGRTLTSNGDGTDHAWGGVQIVVGQSVRGRRIFGRYPSLALNGPDDVGGGRMIPERLGGSVRRDARALVRHRGRGSSARRAAHRQFRRTRSRVPGLTRRCCAADGRYYYRAKRQLGVLHASQRTRVVQRRAITIALATAAPVAAQQQVPFRNDIPVAPQGISERPLPAQPVRYETAEGQNIEVTVVTRGLARPWSLAFVASDTILVTERAGTLRVIRAGKLDAEPVAGVPAVRAEGLAGSWTSRCIRTSRRTATCISPTANRSAPTTPPSRSRAAAGTGVRCATRNDVFVAGAETTGGARMAFGGDGMLYVSAGGGGEQPSAGSRQPRRQSAAADAGRPRAARQSIRRPRRLQARDLHARPSQHARPRGASGDGQDLASRDGAERRRRGQHPRARRQLRLAARELRPHVSGPAPIAALSTGRLHRSRRVLGAVDLDVGARVLHRRSVAEMARRHFRRRHALRRDSEHGQARAHSHQRES